MLPQLRRLELEFGDRLAVIGVHAGKFARERETGAIRSAVAREGIGHPVVNDQALRIWQSFAVRAWPTLVLISAQGRVVARQEGEGPYADLRERVRREVAPSQGRRASTAAAAKDPTGGLLRFPGGIAVTDGGTVYLSDSGHHRVLAWRGGEIRAAWGDGEPGLVDGEPQAARLHGPQGLAAIGGQIWVADSTNHALRRIDRATGRMATAVRSTAEPPDDAPLGPGTLRSPWALASSGEAVFIAAAGSHQIWRLDRTAGTLAPYAGSGYEALHDADLRRARLAQPMALAVHGGDLVVADAESSAVRIVPASGQGRVGTLVGTGLFDFGNRQGAFEDTLLQHPQGIALLGRDIYVADTYNDQIVRLDLHARESSVALAGLREPAALCAHGGRLYIADTGNHRILRWFPGAEAAEVLIA